MPKIYFPRTTAPKDYDKNWIHWGKNGLNECILIAGNSVLPNCVGYCWGRWYELLGIRPKLSKGNAENWWDAKDGYPRGQTPKLGSVICWRKGLAHNASDGAGHVAIVEEIYPDGSILVSASAYGGQRFFLQTLKPPYVFGRAGAFTLQGFIHIPFEYYPRKTTEEIAKEVIQGKWGTGAVRKSKLLQCGYDYALIQAKVNEILADRPKPPVKKSVEQIAKEVINGVWGNGEERKKRLVGAGYDYAVIQARVNELLEK
jgi:hypothetical protein